MAKIQIRNKRTGEIREVEDTEVGQYGLQAPTQSPSTDFTQDNQQTNAMVNQGQLPQQQAEVFPQGANALERSKILQAILETGKVQQPTTGGQQVQQPTDSKPETITGRTLQEHQDALRRTRDNTTLGKAEKKRIIGEVEDAYATELQFQKDFGELSETAQSKKVTQQKFEKNAKAAKDLLVVLDARASGEITGKAADDALNFAAGKWAESTFDTGGKQLTEAEISILQGTRPAIEVVKQDFFEKMIGKVPAQTGKVLDDEATLRIKAEMAIAQAEGRDVSPETLARLQGTQEGEEPSLLADAGTDAKEMLNTILGTPGAQFEDGKRRGEQGLGPQTQVSMLMDLLKGQGQEYNEAFGRPLEGGDILGRMGERARKKPVTTVLDFLPFLGAIKGLKGASTISKIDKALPDEAAVIDDVAKGTSVIDDVVKVDEKALSGRGSRTRAKNLNPKVPDNPYYSRSVEELVSTQKRLGLNGNAENQLRQMPAKADFINNKVKGLVKGKTVKGGTKTIRDNIKIQVEKVDYLGEEATFNKELTKLENRVGKKIDGKGETTYELKSDLAGEMSNVFKKLDQAKDLTPKEAAKLAYWKALKDSLDTISPQIRDINTLQNDMNTLSRSLVPMQGKGGVQIPFTPFSKVGGPQIQTGKDFIGRLLQKGQ